MPRKKKAVSAQQELLTITKEAKAMLDKPYAEEPSVQMQLFEGFAEQKAQQKPTEKWAWQDELLAQFLARGYSKLDAYCLSHPEVKTTNKSTLYPNASRACNRSNIQARVETLRKELEERALMSTTEYFSLLTSIARWPSKKQMDALKLIGQIKGVFHADKGLPGSDGTPIVVRWETPKSKGDNNA